MTTTAADEVLLETVKAGWEAVRAIEPATGRTDKAHVQTARDALQSIQRVQDAGLAAISDDDREGAVGAIASVYARAAAVAIAAGDETTGHAWILEAEQRSPDEDQRAELAAARRSLERYRALVHGRNLFGRGKDGAARASLKPLAKEGDKDAISRAALAELAAPRPLVDGKVPALWRFNGFGLGFYGRRDRWSDGSYATTHCLSALWIPVIPIGAYRVQDADKGYRIFAREPLSRFARVARLVMIAGIVLGVAGIAIATYLQNPDRLARKRFDAALEAASSGDPEPEAALARLDVELRDDLDRVDSGRAQRAGAAVVRLTAGMVPSPFTADALEQATRVVRRFEALPALAQNGAARDTMIAALERWIAAVPADLETQLALLREEAGVFAGTGDPRAKAVEARITAARLAVAAALAEPWPMEALAILVEPPVDPATLDAATAILQRVVDSPSLLDDADADVEAWLAAVPAGEPLRDRVIAQRELGTSARADTDDDDVTPARLAAMQKARPWDQRAAAMLAREELAAGKLEAAATRLGGFGAPGVLIRDARFMLGQIAEAQGRLADADELYTRLVQSRLRRFVLASAALDAAAAAIEKRVEGRLRTGDLPPELSTKLENVSLSDAEKNEAVAAWYQEVLEADPTASAARSAYHVLGDVVPFSLAAGAVKLRRAQAMAGPERDAMLLAAERTFLSIRTQAEGQPEFHLGLGEIYARLGKSTESDAEFQGLIDRGDPALALQVAQVYRNIGGVERSRQVATDVYEHSSSPTKDGAAILLGMLANDDDDEREAWFRKADQKNLFVRTSLLEIEGNRLYREGKYAECGAKFAEAARAHLSSPGHGENNAALDHQRRFDCTGDIAALRDAETTQDRAYRDAPDDPIVVGNLGIMLEENAGLRAVAKRVDLRALKLTVSDASNLLAVLVAGGEREAIAAELAADPRMRRSAELLAQFELLAPSNTTPYERQLRQAQRRRDAAAAAAVLERMRRAKALDTSGATEGRKRWLTGTGDANFLVGTTAVLAHMTRVLAGPKLDAKTGAAARYLAGSTRIQAGLYQRDAKAIAEGRAQILEAMKLWPAIDAYSEVVSSLIDEAGITADATAWLEQRRLRSSIFALAAMTSSGAPLAATIRGSAPWREVLGFARRDTTTPGASDVLLARLLDDPELTTRAAARDDALVRTALEINRLADPTDVETDEAIAVLGPP